MTCIMTLSKMLQKVRQITTLKHLSEITGNYTINFYMNKCVLCASLYSYVTSLISIMFLHADISLIFRSFFDLHMHINQFLQKFSIVVFLKYNLLCSSILQFCYRMRKKFNNLYFP